MKIGFDFDIERQIYQQYKTDTVHLKIQINSKPNMLCRDDKCYSYPRKI